MNPRPDSEPEGPFLSPDDLERVVAVCDRFESAWKAGQRLDVEAEIGNAPKELQSLILRELLALEVELRQGAGESPDPEGYRRRFPDLAPQDLDHAFRTRPFFGDSGPETTAPGSERPGLGTTAPMPSGRSRTAAPTLGPLGRYQTRERVGEGGMGEVYRVHDDRLNRDLALKVMHARYQHDPSMRRRFVEEAQVTGQLQYPGVPPVFERDELPDGRLYYTMKLVEGRTWHDLLNERPDPTQEPARFLSIFEQVARTVAYAHSKHVLHRDLKPLNVMVGRFGEVQVMDWGLAKVLGSLTSEGPDEPAPGGEVQTVRSQGPHSDTQFGAAIGTSAYMPPEQAQGEIEKVDERADVFALGSILCQVLTGSPAYAGRDRDELARKAREGDLADARERLDACGAEPELVALAKDCLAAEPLDRLRDAEEVAQRVADHLNAVQERLEAAKLARAQAETKAVEERKRRQWQLGLAAAALAVVVLVGVGLSMGLNRLVRGDGLLDEAFRLCDQAERDPIGGDPAPAQAVHKQAQEALGELGAFRGERVAELQGRIEGVGKVHALVRTLEAVRGNRGESLVVHFTIDCRVQWHVRTNESLRKRARPWGVATLQPIVKWTT